MPLVFAGRFRNTKTPGKSLVQKAGHACAHGYISALCPFILRGEPVFLQDVAIPAQGRIVVVGTAGIGGIPDTLATGCADAGHRRQQPFLPKRLRVADCSPDGVLLVPIVVPQVAKVGAGAGLQPGGLFAIPFIGLQTAFGRQYERTVFFSAQLTEEHIAGKLPFIGPVQQVGGRRCTVDPGSFPGNL